MLFPFHSMLKQQRLERFVSTVNVEDLRVQADPAAAPGPSAPGPDRTADGDWVLPALTAEHMAVFNARIRAQAGRVITFLYLKPPSKRSVSGPSPAAPWQADECTRYVKFLDALTEDVGPCLMVHGSEVTSTVHI